MKTLHGVRIFGCAALILLATMARAGDDTARFYGTWTSAVSVNGQTITIVSIHDANGYRNFVRTPTGDVPAGDGTFSAENGKWSSNAATPNNGGVYHFIGNDRVIATNAAGQTVIWIRDKSAAAPAPPPSPAKGPTPVDANTAANRETGYVPPNDRPGTSFERPAVPPTAPSSAVAPRPDPSLSPAMNAGMAALARKDYNTAWRDFMPEAQKGDSNAEAAVGSMLFQHTNPPGTGFYAQCEKWLQASANQGNEHGMAMLAQYYFTEGRNVAGGINPGVNNAPISPQQQQAAEAKFKLARQWFEKSAAKGDVYAMGNLAIMLDSGTGGPREPARAAQLRAAVKAGPDASFAKRANADPAGQALAASWQSGHYADAIKTAEASAAKGEASSEALLGRAYYEGVGVPRNYTTALTWLNKAVAQNNADGMFFLGLMYEHGSGVTQDLNQALKLFDQATDRGQNYAKMEAAGLREGDELNRLTHRGRGAAADSGLPSDGMCTGKGGTQIGSQCWAHGQYIDPYEYDPYAESGGGGYEPEPAYEPAPEPEQ
jgi:TPR repeat protein